MRLAQLFVDIVGDSRRFDRTMRGVRSSLSSTANLARVLTSGIGGAAGGLFAGGIQSAIEMESAMSKVRKTTGLSADEIERLKKELQSMSIRLAGSSLTELTEVAAIAGRLGINGVEDVASFTEAIAKIRIAMDDIPADEAANSIARILHVFNMGTGEALSLASAVNKLDDTSTASGRSILDVTRRLSGIASTMGLGAAETVALSTALLDAGVSAEVAGTTFTQVFAKMTKEPELFARVARKSAVEFSTTMKKSPLEAIKQVALGLRRLSPEGKINALDSLGLKGTRVQASFLQFANTVDTLAGKVNIASREMKTMASIEAEVAVQAMTTKAQIEVMNNRLSIMADGIGRRILPSINALLQGLGQTGDSLAIMGRGDYMTYFVQNFKTLIESAIGPLEGFWNKVSFFARNLDIGWQAMGLSVMEFVDTFKTAMGYLKDVALATIVWMREAFANAFVFDFQLPEFKMPPLPKFGNMNDARAGLLGEMLRREQESRAGTFDKPKVGGKVPPGGTEDFAGGSGKKAKGEVIGLEQFARELLAKSFRLDPATAAAQATAKNTERQLTYVQRFTMAIERIERHGVAARAFGRT